MKTITLTYDGRNTIAKKTLDYILSLGVFKVKEDYRPNKETLEAMREVREGKCKAYDSYEEMKRDILK